MFADVVCGEVGHGLEECWRSPGGQGAKEILPGTENSKQLEFMICVVQDHMVTQVFLELAKESCCKSGLLMKLLEVLFPLLIEVCF